MARFYLDATEQLHQFAQQRAAAGLADHRQRAAQVNGVAVGAGAFPHRAAGPDDQQLGRVAREHRLQLRPDEGQQCQDVHAPHALPLRRGNGDLGFAQRGAPAAQRARQHPPGWPIKQTRHVINTETVFTDTRPRCFDTFPAVGQDERQPRHQLGTVLLIEAGRRHQLLATEQRPLGRGIGVETAVLEGVIEANPVTQTGGA